MIDLTKPKDQATIVVAMSGGVDSSTVAAMLVEEGYNVIGITLQLYDYGVFTGKKGACCAGQDIYDAKMVADRIGIPHYVLDYESKFKEAVIDDFVSSYLQGETPVPCIKCNQSVKFNDLLKFAKNLDADALATGHYVRRVLDSNGVNMLKGLDANKDQSYFLFTTTQEQLNFTHFPLGNYTKEETRNLAKKYGLEVADKPDSQDICFVPDGSYVELIKKMKPEAFKKGSIKHINGQEMGSHDGIIGFTIGQRKRIGISHPEPLYVIKIDPEENTIYVGEENFLSKTTFEINDTNLLVDNLEEFDTQVKTRYKQQPSNAKIEVLDGNRALVHLYQSQRAITPGQACVIYDGDRMLGGGWITRKIS